MYSIVLNPLGKYRLYLIFALEHSLEKPLTSAAMSTLLDKHSKFMIKPPSILSIFVQLLDKHSIYTVIGKTKKKFSGYFSRDKKSFELGRQKVPLILHLNIAILTQHYTQIGILSSDKSFLWKGFTAQGFTTQSEKVICNSL